MSEWLKQTMAHLHYGKLLNDLKNQKKQTNKQKNYDTHNLDEHQGNNTA